MFANTLTAALRRCAAFAAAAGLALGATGAAAQFADGDKGDNVYIGVFKDDVKPIVVFVLSDRDAGGYAPKDKVALYARPDYEQGERFNPLEACRFTLDFGGDIDEKFKATPIYGPASTQDTIDPFTLPSYMARESVKVLLAENLVESEFAAAPYFNCTGFVWSQLMNQSKETWDKILGELVEEAKKLKKDKKGG